MPLRSAIPVIGRFLLLSLCVLTVTAPSARAQRKSTGVARFDASVDSAVNWLKDELAAVPLSDNGHTTLLGYALFKAGEPENHKVVAAAIGGAVGRSAGSQYRADGNYDHIYTAGVDAMLLADVDAKSKTERFKNNLQTIANYIQAVQKPDGSWSDNPQNPQAGDVSMTQYGVLGLWAAQRAGCQVSPAAFDRAAMFHLNRGNSDGGWGYRPGTSAGLEKGASTPNMTLAGIGSVSIARMLLHGRKIRERKVEKETLFDGALEKIDPLAEMAGESAADNGKNGPAFGDYNAQAAVGTLDGRVDRGFAWINARFNPVSQQAHKIYFYYCMERAAAINDLPDTGPNNWFETYGDGLLRLQAEDGSFNTHAGKRIGTAFAILYFMRSTKSIIEAAYGGGLMRSTKGNPLADKEKKEDPAPLDQLLAELEKVDFDALEVEPEKLVESIQFADKEDLVGNIGLLEKMVDHPDGETRATGYWALGRTGDFKYIPLMLRGLRDEHLQVNTNALDALRYIARKPGGFGLPSNPLAGQENAAGEAKVKAANKWRTRAAKTWGNWYASVRPYNERDGLDQLRLSIPEGDGED